MSVRVIHITDNCEIYNDMGYGWRKGKGQPKWHEVAYKMWKGMWRRIYTNINYFGCTIYPDFKLLSNYIRLLETLDNFELFKTHPYGWSVDKDIKGGTYIGYYPQYMSLVTISDNAKEVRSRVGSPLKDIITKEKACSSKRKPIIGINKTDNTLLIFKSAKDAKEKGFTPNLITNVLKGKKPSHGGYKWFYFDMNDREG